MTLERPMFPPVDPTRRHLLTIAAGAAVVAIVPSVPALSAHVPIMSPAISAAADNLAHASAILMGAKRTYHRFEDAVDKWEAANPMPTSRRGRRKWIKKADAYRLTLVAKPWQDLMQAEADFAAAQDALAATPPADAGDIRTKIACAALYDAVELARINRAPIARAVVADLITQADRGQA